MLERAHEIGYRPNPFAQSLITKKTQIVGMVVSDLTNPFYPEVMTRLTSLLQKQGMNVMLASAEQADGTELNSIIRPVAYLREPKAVHAARWWRRRADSIWEWCVDGLRELLHHLSLKLRPHGPTATVTLIR